MTITCCYPQRIPGPSGVRLRHTCAARKNQPYDDVAKITSKLAARHAAETAAAGIEGGRTWEATVPGGAIPAAPIHSDCGWHTRLGIRYTTSGSCTGPACREYAEAMADTEVDA